MITEESNSVPRKTELKTYESSANEVFEDIWRKCEYSNEVREFIDVLMPDLSISIVSTRDFAGDPFIVMMDELFA